MKRNIMLLLAVCLISILINANTMVVSGVAYDKNVEVEQNAEKKEVVGTQELTCEVEEEITLKETGIKLYTENVKKTYSLNEELDFEGLNVVVVYNTGEEKKLSNENYKIFPADTTTYGSKEVVISYGDYSEKFDIEVCYVVTDIEPTTKYASCSLNLREGASTQFEKLTTISVNTEVTVIGEVDNGWVKVLYKDEEYFCSGKYLSDKKVEVVSTQPASPYDNKVTGEPGTSADVINSANANWNSQVPNWLKQKFVESGWTIEISAVPLNQRYGYSISIAGVADYDARKIFIDNRMSPTRRAILHELGHFIDDLYGFPSYSSEFAEIFNAEKYSFVDCTSVGDGHETSSVSEYFASVFQNAIINGANCKNQAPRSYEFVCRYMH